MHANLEIGIGEIVKVRSVRGARDIRFERRLDLFVVNAFEVCMVEPPVAFDVGGAVSQISKPK